MLSRAAELQSINRVSVNRRVHHYRSKGSGTIAYRADRNKPYRVKIPVESFRDDKGRFQTKYKTLGSYKSRKAAEEALSNYNSRPYDIDSKIVSFSDLYNAWSEDYFKQFSTASTCRTVKCTYAYLHDFADMPIRQFNVGTIKDMMADAYIIEGTGSHAGQIKCASLNTQERIKSLCNMMFDYALERNLVFENPARKIKINSLIAEIDKASKKKTPFSSEQIFLLKKHVSDTAAVDMIIIQMYTGLRPQELCNIETQNVHLDQCYMIGGMKTDAGRDRIIPLHQEILPLIRRRLYEAEEICKSMYLFNYAKGDQWKLYTYDKYRHTFNQIMSLLELEGFSPHCCRHTFATFAEFSALRPIAIKQIMGHSLNGDVTDKFYKHTDIEFLVAEVNKLNFGEKEDE